MVDVKKSEPTRYLCAAAYLDEKFRDRVIHEVVEEEFRAIGDSPGVDVPTVVKHCLAARRRVRVRDALLTAAIPVFLILAFTLSRQTNTYTDAYYSYSYSSFNPGLFFLMLILLYVAAWVIMFVDLLGVNFGIIIPHMLPGRFNPDAVQLESDQLAKMPLPQDKNLVVYSGFAPFVGDGMEVNRWSFAINIGHGKKEMGQKLTPQPFTLHELYNLIGNDISRIPFQGLRVENVLYVNGSKIRDDRRFLPQPTGRPYIQVDPALVSTFVEAPSDDMRHYLRIRVMSWSGELVFSQHFRCERVGEKLYIEVSHYVLGPVKAAYRTIDSYERFVTFRSVRQLLGQSARQASPALIAAPGRLLRIIFQAISRNQQRADAMRQIQEQQTFDYGAATSIREEAAAGRYQQYFQRMDSDQYQKVCERQLLESIITFFDSKNIDTSDLVEQRNNILNNGVIVSGGSISAENLAVGNQANAGNTNNGGVLGNLLNTNRRGNNGQSSTPPTN